MSHFTVLVIGDDVKKQLAPFHEFECTGLNDEYVQDVDVTDESIKWGTDEKTGEFDLDRALGYHGLEDKIVASEAEVDRRELHKYGYAIVQDGKLVKAVNRTNPNKKWDWWIVGGRWTGFFKIKPGKTGELGEPGILTSPAPKGTADAALKGDIDFDGMRDKAGEAAAACYDKARGLMGETVAEFVPWETLRDETHKGDIGAARTAYHAQEAVKALHGGEMWSYSVEDFLCSRDEFISRARCNALATFAVIKDGKWYERGEMGWWGIVSNEKGRDEWNMQFAALMDSLPDDTLLTVVDCHI